MGVAKIFYIPWMDNPSKERMAMKKGLTTFLIIMFFCVTFCSQFNVSVFAEPRTKILVDVLLDYGNGTQKWASCILSKPSNDTVYNATRYAVATLNVTWYEGSVFVDAIDDVWNAFPYYWMWWYWNSSESRWMLGPVACNFYALEDCDIIAWYYENCSAWPPEPPLNPPIAQIDVLLDYGNKIIKWYENVKVVGVASVFKATKTVAAVECSLWGEDIFVDAINGVWNNYDANYFWLYWCWNFTSACWDMGSVACNKYLLSNGDIIAWHYEDCSAWPPAPPLPTVSSVSIEIEPSTLNLKSKDRWITCYIKLPEGYNATKIDASSIKLNSTIQADPSAPIEIGDYGNDGVPDITVKFNRMEVASFIYDQGIRYGNVTLKVSGIFMDRALLFKGSNVIKVRMPGDINGDGKVNIEDLLLAAKAFNSYPGHPRWNYAADENEDNIINIVDFVSIAINFGKNY